eukprot:2433255-Rhodomonas_salina.1
MAYGARGRRTYGTSLGSTRYAPTPALRTPCPALTQAMRYQNYITDMEKIFSTDIPKSYTPPLSPARYYHAPARCLDTFSYALSTAGIHPLLFHTRY